MLSQDRQNADLDRSDLGKIFLKNSSTFCLCMVINNYCSCSLFIFSWISFISHSWKKVEQHCLWISQTSEVILFTALFLLYYYVYSTCFKIMIIFSFSVLKKSSPILLLCFLVGESWLCMLLLSCVKAQSLAMGSTTNI